MTGIHDSDGPACSTLARRLRPGGLGLAILLNTLVVGGCGLTLSSEARVENNCSSNADCPGATCDVGLGMCVSPAEETLRIGLEITPPAGPTAVSAATHSLGPFDIDGPEDSLNLMLPAPIKVVGTVRSPGSPDPVGATVRFQRPGNFVGARAVDIEARTTAEPAIVEDGAEADYSTELVPDLDYDIVVEPAGEWESRYPPLHFSHSIPGGGDVIRIDIDYPDSLEEVVGYVIGSMDAPVDGLSIWAVDADTGERVSSTAVTGESEDLGAGEFSILLSPGVTEASYRIRIGTGETTTSPTIFADPQNAFPDARGYKRILVPMFTPVCYRGTVELGDTGEVAPEASLTFTSRNVIEEDLGLRGTFRTTIVTETDGSFEAQLLPGTYEVLVTPPVDHELERFGVLFETTFQILVEGNPGECVQGQLFTLPERARVGGTVRTADGRLMGGAQVTASALGRALDELSAARYNRTGDTATDPTGQFNLPLDVGVYDLFIKPPDESDFPWIVRPDLIIGSSDPTYSDIYQLSAPVPVSGTITGVTGDMVGTEIRAFAVVTSADGAERSVAVGRTLVEEDGSFRLLLPARL